MSEIFKVIPAYPNYEVSTEGRIRRIKTGHIMNYVDNGKGYKSVKLYNSTRPQGRLCLVHRLVLSTFQRIDVDMDVNHKDGIKSNNKLSNLEWVTKSENTRHAHATGLFNNKLTKEQVLEIKERVSKINRETYKQIASEYGINQSVVGKIANGSLYSYI